MKLIAEVLILDSSSARSERDAKTLKRFKILIYGAAEDNPRSALTN